MFFHALQSNMLLLINPRNGSATEIITQSLMKKIASKMTRNDEEVDCYNIVELELTSFVVLIKSSEVSHVC